MTKTMTRWTLAGCTALGAMAMFDAAPATADSALTSVVSDPVGDAQYKSAPAFQDITSARLTKTAGGDFELLMEMAGSIPAEPRLPPPGVREIWWYWAFDFDPDAFPPGAPYPAHSSRARPELIAYVSWDGTKFAGTLIDRRPALVGGEAIVTPVPFSINGATVGVVLDSGLIGDAPASFHWAPGTRDWSGPIGSNGNNEVDGAQAVFNP